MLKSQVVREELRHVFDKAQLLEITFDSKLKEIQENLEVLQMQFADIRSLKHQVECVLNRILFSHESDDSVSDSAAEQR